MRIGIVTATYLPSKNGVATSTALFVRGLRALGHEVRVFAPEHLRRGNAPEFGVWRLPSTGIGAPEDYPLLLPVGAAALAKLAAHDFDVVHAMHPFVAGQLALRLARQRNVPLIFTAHTQYHQYLHYARLPRRLGRLMVRRHVRAFARAADAVLIPGQAMGESLRRYKYRGDVTLLPNPVDLSAFGSIGSMGGSAVRVRHGIPAQVPLLVYLGRLAPEKNLEVLLAAFAQALADMPDARLLMVGDGPSRAALERRAQHLPVVFAGGAPYDQVPHYLGAADAFVTASTSEVLPMSMIEALAAGAPLIAARSPAAEDLVQDGVNGSLCEPDAASLAAGMVRILTGGNLALLQAGARRSAQAFDVLSLARQLQEVYASAIARRTFVPDALRPEVA